MNTMKFLSLLSAVLVLVVITSCGGSSGEGLDKYVGQYLDNNSDAILIMKMDVAGIMDKSDVKNLPDVGFQLLETFNKIDSSMALSEHVYMIASGPLDYDGMPENTALFIAVKDKEEAAKMFNEMGYFFEEIDGVNLHDEDGLAIGYTDDLAIIGITGVDSLAQSFVSEAFIRAKKGTMNEFVMKNMDYEGDMIISLNLQNLYATSNTDLNQLPVQQLEKIKQLAENSYVNTALSFNDGEIVVETHLAFNEELQKAMFFDESGNVDVLTKLGPGEPLAAFSMNLDLDKMETFMTEVYPEGMKEMYKNLGPQGMILEAIGGGKLSSFVNGEFAVAITGFSEAMLFAVPQVNVYSGLGESSGDFSDLLIALLEEQEATQLGEGVFDYEGMKIKFNSSGVFVTSDTNLTDDQLGNTPMKVPAGIQGFGEKPFTFYVDFTKLKFSEGAEIMAGEAEIVMEELAYIYFEADNTKSKLVIKTTDGSVNVLKKSVDVALEAIL